MAPADFNERRAVLGLPGMGKTTLLAEWAEELDRRAVVLVHDETGDFPTRAPFEQVRLERVRAKLREGRPGIHVVVDASVGQFVGLVQDIVNLQARPPVVAIFDEAGMLELDEGDVAAIKKKLRTWYIRSRHLRVGICLGVQDSNLVDYKLLGMATQIAVFRLTDEYALQKLRAMQVPETVLVAVPSLPKYRYIVGQPGFPESWRTRTTTP